MQKTRFFSLLLVSLLLPIAPGHAAPLYQFPAGATSLDAPEIVAGYRAVFTCSAYFFAGRSLDDIKKIELIDVEGKGYPDPVIDTQHRVVTAYDKTGTIFRRAAYRDSMGCTLLPPHWTLQDLPRLPQRPDVPTPDVSALAFPAGDRVDLPESGIDPRFPELATVLDRAFDGVSHAKTPGTVTNAVLVITRDKNKRYYLIAERYAKGFGIHTSYRTWSTAKSISAALLAIASQQGLLQLNEPAAIPEWPEGDPRRAITYKDLMWMSSGLQSGGANTAAVYFGGQDVVSAVTGSALEFKPGTHWRYANNDTLLLLRALRHVLNDDARYLRFPYDELLHPLGMYHTRMEVDYQGNFVSSSQVYTTARDLARFGIFLDSDGVLAGKRILPEGWIKFISTPAPSRPAVKGEWGYGAQFWLLDTMRAIPKGTYTTAGNKGQYVTVVPGHDVIIVRTGVDPQGVEYKQDRLVAEVLTVLEKK